MVPATIACSRLDLAVPTAGGRQIQAPSNSPSPCTSPDTTNCPAPRMSPTNTELAPMKVGGSRIAVEKSALLCAHGDLLILSRAAVV